MPDATTVLSPEDLRAKLLKALEEVQKAMMDAPSEWEYQVARMRYRNVMFLLAYTVSI